MAFSGNKGVINDRISDMLTRIRNANLAKKSSVSIPKTKVTLEIAQILEKEGFIESFQISSSGDLTLRLKYLGREKKPCITNLKRISKPGLRIYTNSREIPNVLGGMGILILSTSKGLMTGKKAKQLNVGGEVICYVY